MKKNAILYTAARLFAERGFANTSTMLLAKEAGVAEGTIFRHFKTKDEIFFALTRHVKDELLAEIQRYLEVHPQKNGLETVLCITRAFCVFVKKNRMEFGLLFCDAPSRAEQSRDEAYQSIKDIYQAMRAMLLEAVRTGREDGSINRALYTEDTATILVCLLGGLMQAMRFDLVGSGADTSAIIPNLVGHIQVMLENHQS